MLLSHPHFLSSSAAYNGCSIQNPWLCSHISRLQTPPFSYICSKSVKGMLWCLSNFYLRWLVYYNLDRLSCHFSSCMSSVLYSSCFCVVHWLLWKTMAMDRKIIERNFARKVNLVDWKLYLSRKSTSNPYFIFIFGTLMCSWFVVFRSWTLD